MGGFCSSSAPRVVTAKTSGDPAEELTQYIGVSASAIVHYERVSLGLRLDEDRLPAAVLNACAAPDEKVNGDHVTELVNDTSGLSEGSTDGHRGRRKVRFMDEVPAVNELLPLTLSQLDDAAAGHRALALVEGASPSPTVSHDASLVADVSTSAATMGFAALTTSAYTTHVPLLLQDIACAWTLSHRTRDRTAGAPVATSASTTPTPSLTSARPTPPSREQAQLWRLQAESALTDFVTKRVYRKRLQQLRRRWAGAYGLLPSVEPGSVLYVPTLERVCAPVLSSAVCEPVSPPSSAAAAPAPATATTATNTAAGLRFCPSKALALLRALLINLPMPLMPFLCSRQLEALVTMRAQRQAEAAQPSQHPHGDADDTAEDSHAAGFHHHSNSQPSVATALALGTGPDRTPRGTHGAPNVPSWSPEEMHRRARRILLEQFARVDVVGFCTYQFLLQLLVLYQEDVSVGEVNDVLEAVVREPSPGLVSELLQLVVGSAAAATLADDKAAAAAALGKRRRRKKVRTTEDTTNLDDSHNTSQTLTAHTPAKAEPRAAVDVTGPDEEEGQAKPSSSDLHSPPPVDTTVPRCASREGLGKTSPEGQPSAVMEEMDSTDIGGVMYSSTGEARASAAEEDVTTAMAMETSGPDIPVPPLHLLRNHEEDDAPDDEENEAAAAGMMRPPSSSSASSTSFSSSSAMLRESASDAHGDADVAAGEWDAEAAAVPPLPQQDESPSETKAPPPATLGNSSEDVAALASNESSVSLIERQRDEHSTVSQEARHEESTVPGVQPQQSRLAVMVPPPSSSSATSSSVSSPQSAAGNGDKAPSDLFTDSPLPSAPADGANTTQFSPPHTPHVASTPHRVESALPLASLQRVSSAHSTPFSHLLSGVSPVRANESDMEDALEWGDAAAALLGSLPNTNATEQVTRPPADTQHFGAVADDDDEFPDVPPPVTTPQPGDCADDMAHNDKKDNLQDEEGEEEVNAHRERMRYDGITEDSALTPDAVEPVADPVTVVRKPMPLTLQRMEKGKADVQASEGGLSSAAIDARREDELAAAPSAPAVMDAEAHDVVVVHKVRQRSATPPLAPVAATNAVLREPVPLQRDVPADTQVINAPLHADPAAVVSRASVVPAPVPLSYTRAAPMVALLNAKQAFLTGYRPPPPRDGAPAVTPLVGPRPVPLVVNTGTANENVPTQTAIDTPEHDVVAADGTSATATTGTTVARRHRLLQEVMDSQVRRGVPAHVASDYVRDLTSRYPSLRDVGVSTKAQTTDSSEVAPTTASHTRDSRDRQDASQCDSPIETPSRDSPDRVEHSGAPGSAALVTEMASLRKDMHTLEQLSLKLAAERDAQEEAHSFMTHNSTATVQAMRQRCAALERQQRETEMARRETTARWRHLEQELQSSVAQQDRLNAQLAMANETSARLRAALSSGSV